MKRREKQLARIVGVIAGFVAGAVAVLMPLAYYAIGYGALSAATQMEADLKSEIVSPFIGANPEIWRFNSHRLTDIVQRSSHVEVDELIRVIDADGAEVVRLGAPLATPVVAHSVALHDSGVAVGRIEVSRSLRPLILETLVAGLVGLLLAGGAFAAFRLLPMRALKRALAELAREKERAEVTLHSIGDGVISTDARGIVEYANPVAEHIAGWTRGSARGKSLSDALAFVSERTRETVLNPLVQAITENRVAQAPVNTLLARADGREIAVETTAAPICDAEGRVVGGVMVFHDVSAARELNKKLSWQATHDALTGLANRSEFERHLQLALDNAHATGGEHAMCYFDLDQFKVVNDSCGHVAGDELLRELSELLKGRVRAADILARLGGDEFGLLLYGCSLERAQQIAREMLHAVGEFRFRWDNQVFSVGMSIGVVSVTSKAESRRVLLSMADAACYAAKEAGRNRIQAYAPQDEDLAQRREQMGWVGRLSRALDEGRFVLHHQPYLRLSAQPRGGIHVELLLRMLDEHGALVMPGTFIPVAERYNLMSALDRWVIRAAMRGYAKLEERYGADLVMAINLSGASLTEETLAATIIDATRAAQVRPEAVCFEITETTAVNHLRRATAFMAELKGLGFRFALDDFGSGMSSFAYLKALPVDYLKIDGSFVREIASDKVSRTMTEAMNQIGHAMRLHTVAECVENEAILHALRTVGVDYAQGYAVARPMALDAREGVLAA